MLTLGSRPKRSMLQTDAVQMAAVSSRGKATRALIVCRQVSSARASSSSNVECIKRAVTGYHLLRSWHEAAGSSVSLRQSGLLMHRSQCSHCTSPVMRNYHSSLLNSLRLPCVAPLDRFYCRGTSQVRCVDYDELNADRRCGARTTGTNNTFEF
jgi:hypothetical protein